jgi:hypothetical protein
VTTDKRCTGTLVTTLVIGSYGIIYKVGIAVTVFFRGSCNEVINVTCPSSRNVEI